MRDAEFTVFCSVKMVMPDFLSLTNALEEFVVKNATDPKKKGVWQGGGIRKDFLRFSDQAYGGDPPNVLGITQHAILSKHWQFTLHASHIIQSAVGMSAKPCVAGKTCTDHGQH